MLKLLDLVSGNEFKNFDEFREGFWKEVANSNYASEFSKGNIKRMKKGLAP